MKYLATILAAALLALFAWFTVLEVRSWRLKSGVVVAKQYSGAWVQWNYMSDGSMYPTYWPDEWRITIEGKVGDDIIRRSMRVNEATFKLTQKGWTYPPPRATMSEPPQ